MNISRLFSRYWLLLPLLLLTVIIIDQVEEPSVLEPEETLNMSETQSDYYMADFITRKFAADGTLQYLISGDTLAHYPDDGRSEIVMPIVKLARPDTVWEIQSARGRFDPDPDLFTLHGDVTIVRGPDKSQPVIIRTDTLQVATDENLVTTDSRITINASTWQLQAKGLRTAIDDGTLSLLSEVSGTYQVPPPVR